MSSISSNNAEQEDLASAVSSLTKALEEHNQLEKRQRDLSDSEHFMHWHGSPRCFAHSTFPMWYDDPERECEMGFVPEFPPQREVGFNRNCPDHRGKIEMYVHVGDSARLV